MPIQKEIDRSAGAVAAVSVTCPKHLQVRHGPLIPTVRRSFRRSEPEINDASPDRIWRDLWMFCPNGNHDLALTVPSALAIVNENLIEFAKPAVERHGIDRGARPPRRIIRYGAAGVHSGLVLDCASSGLDGLLRSFSRRHAGARLSWINWGALAREPVPAYHARLPHGAMSALLSDRAAQELRSMGRGHRRDSLPSRCARQRVAGLEDLASSLLPPDGLRPAEPSTLPNGSESIDRTPKWNDTSATSEICLTTDRSSCRLEQQPGPESAPIGERVWEGSLSQKMLRKFSL